MDLLIEHATGLLPLEIKSGMALNPEYFRQLNYRNSLSEQPAERAYVLYAGSRRQATGQGTFLPLAELTQLLMTGQG